MSGSDSMDYSPPGSSVHGDSPGKNTGVGCHALLQGIFPTQGSNTGLPHCRWILYHLSHQENPRILAWIAYPFSRGFSQFRNQTGVSCNTGGFFTNWATRGPESSLSQVKTLEFLASGDSHAVSILMFLPCSIWARWCPVMGQRERAAHQHRHLSGPSKGLNLFVN